MVAARMYANRRPRARNATVGYSDLKAAVHKLAVKFQAFPDFRAALDTQYRSWGPRRMPTAEDIGGCVCRGKVVEEVHR